MDYHSDRFRDFSILVLEDGKLKSILPANLDLEGNLHSHQGLTYGGFVFNKNERLNNELKYIYKSLKYLSSNNINVVFYKSFPKLYSSIGVDSIDYSFFYLKAILARRDLSLAINFKDRLDLQKRRVRSIKKANNARIQIVEARSLTDFWSQILEPNLKKRFETKPVHTIEEITSLKAKFPKNIRQFNAYLNNRILAGTTIFETSNVAHAQYISASDEGRKLGAIDLLFYELIKAEFNDKLFFDFGICNDKQGKKINFGLLDWKEGFGGRSYSHDFYKIKTSNFNLLENQIKW